MGFLVQPSSPFPKQCSKKSDTKTALLKPRRWQEGRGGGFQHLNSLQLSYSPHTSHERGVGAESTARVVEGEEAIGSHLPFSGLCVLL